MEYCDRGDLKRFIQNQKEHLPEIQVLDWFNQMTEGVKYIHSKKILHRDLKPANIFLTSQHKVKIGDFGISKILDLTCGMVTTCIGTAVYMAPEVIGGDPYNSKADVWGMGCILYELASLKQAFVGRQYLKNIADVRFIFSL